MSLQGGNARLHSANTHQSAQHPSSDTATTQQQPMERPTFRCRPLRDSGMPIFRDSRVRTWKTGGGVVPVLWLCPLVISIQPDQEENILGTESHNARFVRHPHLVKSKILA